MASLKSWVTQMSKWETKDFGEIILQRQKSTIKVGDADNSGDYLFFTSGDAVLSHSKSIVDNENIFLATGGAATVKFYCGKAAHSTDTWAIYTNWASTNYIYYWLLNCINEINGNMFLGSGLKHLQKKDLKKKKISLPSEKKEQLKIAEVLSTVDEVIEKTNAIIEKYTAVKRGYLQDLLNENNDGMKPHKIQNCFRLRARIGWQNLRADEFKEIGIHLVTGTDFNNGKINWDTCYRVSEERYIQDVGIQLKEKDLLVTKDGTVGKTAFVLDCPEKATLNSHIFLVRATNEKIIPEYLYYILNSRVFFLFLQNILTGTTIKGLTQQNFYKFSFNAPSPTKQHEIVEQLATIDERIQVEKDYSIKLQNIKKGLMQDLLTNIVSVETLLKEEAI